MTTFAHHDFDKPDEVREFEKGRLELINVDDNEIGRLVLEPGWRWSEHVKPIAGTELCEAPHFQYHVAGTMRIQMADGTEFDATPGQITSLPSGHDAWVVGDENGLRMHVAEAGDPDARRSCSCTASRSTGGSGARSSRRSPSGTGWSRPTCAAQAGRTPRPTGTP